MDAIHSPELKLPLTPRSNSSADSALVCWICLDEEKNEPLLGDLCGCRTRFVHELCLKAWIEHSRVLDCKVCTKAFPVSFHCQAPPVRTIPSRAPGAPGSPALARLPTPAEIRCLQTTGIVCVGLTYGFLYAAFSSESLLRYVIVIMSNACILLLLCCVFSATRGDALPRGPGLSRLGIDLWNICVAYISFFTAWLSAWHTIVDLSWETFVSHGMVAHTINAFAFLVSIAMRCFCVTTPGS